MTKEEKVYRELGIPCPYKKKEKKNGRLKLRMLKILRDMFPEEDITDDTEINTHGKLLSQGEFSWMLITQSGLRIGGDEPLSVMLKRTYFNGEYSPSSCAYTIESHD